MTEIKLKVMNIDQCKENDFFSNHDTLDAPIILDTPGTTGTSAQRLQSLASISDISDDDNSKDSNDFSQDEYSFNYDNSIIFEENSINEHLEQSVESIIAKNTNDELKNLIDNLITNEKTAPNLIQKDILKDQSIKNVIIFFNKIVKEIYQNIINEKSYKYSYEYEFDKKLILNTDKIFRKKLKYTLKYYYEDQLGFNVSWNSNIHSRTLKLILKWD